MREGNHIKRNIINLLLTVLAIGAGSCLITLMAVFMSDGQVGTDLLGLLHFQAGLIPIALGLTVFGIFGFVRAQGWAEGSKALWREIPQWQMFIFLLLNSLVIFGEIALVIITQATDEVVLWYEHIPMSCMLICSSAFLVLYARANSYPGSPPAMSGRWM